MKKAILLLLSLSLLAASPVRADLSVEVFYDSLSPHGEWVEIEGYGYCWTPAEVEAEWRPYTNGHWVYTDAGWTWISDEPYGWAVYHYGRWLQTQSVGWVWVPGEEWGPAWVSWRRSPEYVGWAPLPPEVRFSRSVGITRRVDVEFDIGPAYYSFVPVRSFGSDRLRTVIIEPRRNVTIINQTRNITNITYVNQTVINRGPDYELMSRQSERPIRRLKLNRQTDFDADERRIEGGARIEGDALNIPAPRIERSAQPPKPEKVARQIKKAEVNRGWEGAGSEEEIEQVRSRMKQEESEPEAAGAEPTGEPREEQKEEATTTEDPATPPAAEERRERDKAVEPAEKATPEEKPAPSQESTPPDAEEEKPESTRAPARERNRRERAAEREESEAPARRPRKQPETETAPAEAPAPAAEREVEQPEPEPEREAPPPRGRQRQQREVDEQPEARPPRVRQQIEEKVGQAVEAARPPDPAPAAPIEAAPETPEIAPQAEEKQKGNKKKRD